MARIRVRRRPLQAQAGLTWIPAVRGVLLLRRVLLWWILLGRVLLTRILWLGGVRPGRRGLPSVAL